MAECINGLLLKKKKKTSVSYSTLALGVAFTEWITYGQLLAIKSCSSATADSPSLCRSGLVLLFLKLYCAARNIGGWIKKTIGK